MLTNSIITIYHKGFNDKTKFEKWTRYNYVAWMHGGKGASLNRGYADANDVDVRIPYNQDVNINNISIGDIIVKENLDFDIDKQQDLKNYNTYNITSITNNTFGNHPHIHLGGK